MPTVPAGSADGPTASALGVPTNPMNFLMAAAEAHASGAFQSKPVPIGKALQTGKSSPKKHIQVLK